MRSINRRLGGPAETKMLGSVARLAFMMTAMLALAACGVKGSLENPPEAAVEPTADASSGEGKAAGEAPKPHKGFILDPLLR